VRRLVRELCACDRPDPSGRVRSSNALAAKCCTADLQMVGTQRARVAELADALDSGFHFWRFHACSAGFWLFHYSIRRQQLTSITAARTGDSIQFDKWHKKWHSDSLDSLPPRVWQDDLMLRSPPPRPSRVGRELARLASTHPTWCCEQSALPRVMHHPATTAVPALYCSVRSIGYTFGTKKGPH
jgi:hypothetical protein